MTTNKKKDKIKTEIKKFVYARSKDKHGTPIEVSVVCRVDTRL